MLKEIKRSVIKMTYNAQSAHLGSALSVIEILYTLYFRIANITKENCKKPERDKIILSKGHASTALYAALSKKGIIPEKYLETYAQNGGSLPCHIDMNSADGLECAAGSLGHGLGIGIGIALSDRTDARSANTYVILGDGELDEGSVWEGFMFITANNLNNLTVIIDKNGLQASGTTEYTLKNENLEEKLTAFGFKTFSVNGHDVSELESALLEKSDRPKAVIAYTIKGHGYSKIENTVESHYIRLTEDDYNAALSELGD